MSLVSFKSVITLCSISILAAACSPRTNYQQQPQQSNLPLYTAAPQQQQIRSVPIAGQPQTVQSTTLPQVAYNQAGIVAPVTAQPQTTYSMLSTPPQQSVTSAITPTPIQNAQPQIQNQGQTFAYTIQKGDTLFAVGRKFNLHPQDIANHNSMINPHNLAAGQVIQIPSHARQYPVDGHQKQSNAGSVTQPVVNTAAITNNTVTQNNSSLLDAVRSNRTGIASNSVKYFKMPQQGRIIQNYDGKTATGVRVVVPNNTALRAASSGEVIYVGSVDGYGKMVLIRHDGGYVSNYAGLNAIHVKQGQKLKAGDMIATAASNGSSSMAEVLFELRQGTKTVNPHAFIG